MQVKLFASKNFKMLFPLIKIYPDNPNSGSCCTSWMPSYELFLSYIQKKTLNITLQQFAFNYCKYQTSFLTVHCGFSHIEGCL